MRNIYFTTLVFFFLAIDIISKYGIEKHLDSSIGIIPGWVSIEKIYNTGIAFSVAVPSLLLKVLTVVLIFGIILYYFYERKSHTSWYYDVGFALIIGGAIGNGIERIFRGYVTDFISVSYFSVFNIADSCITIGAMVLIWYYYIKNTH